MFGTMTIEQRPELNRYIDPSIPLTWGYRKQMVKAALPMLLFLWVVILDRVMLEAWFHDGVTWGLILTVACALPFLTVFILGMVELQVRISHRSKRVLRIQEKTS